MVSSTSAARNLINVGELRHVLLTGLIESLCIPQTKPQSIDFKLAVIKLMKLIGNMLTEIDKFYAILNLV